MLQDQKSIQQPKRDCRDYEQIHRRNAIGMIAQKGLPALRRGLSSPRHVFCHTGLSDIDAKLEQFAVDPRCSPKRVRDAHVANELANVCRCLWPATARSGFPAPIGSEPSAAPADHRLRLQPINLPIHDLVDIERAIASLAEQPNGGVLFPPDVTIFSLLAQVSALLARYRVPAISIYSALTAAGGLVSYGPDRTAMFRQSASYVDRILRGEKPGDLPFQQPTMYRLVINLKAAKALNLTVPDTLLVAADEVIE